MGPVALGTCSWRSSSSDAGVSEAARYTVSDVSSISTVPMDCGCIVFDTSAPTATSDRPSCAALSRSTVTAMYGSDAARLLET